MTSRTLYHLCSCEQQETSVSDMMRKWRARQVRIAIAMLRVADLHKQFASLPILRGVNLSVQQGQVAVIIGASGCGKSTLLRCINGLEHSIRAGSSVGELTLVGAIIAGDRGSSRTSRPPAGRHGVSEFQSFSAHERAR